MPLPYRWIPALQFCLVETIIICKYYLDIQDKFACVFYILVLIIEAYLLDYVKGCANHTFSLDFDQILMARFQHQVSWAEAKSTHSPSPIKR